MRYRSALWLALFCKFAFAGEASTLTVVLRQDSATPPGVLSAMEREAESVVATAGIRLAWQSAPASETYPRVAVIRLQGQCRPNAPWPVLSAGGHESGEPLGQTQITDGNVLPFADIRCDAVRKLIRPDRQTGDREELLGRALGRVVAHELYHILLRTARHGRDGLASPALTSSDLLSIRNTFARNDERILSGSGSSGYTEYPAESGR